MKVPEPRKLPSGSWFIQLRLDGQSVPVTAYTKKECLKQAELIKAEHRNGKRAEKKQLPDLTLRELIDGYIEKYRAVRSPSTTRGYKAYLDSRFAAYMGKQLSAIRWQKMINDEQELCGPKTLKNAWSLVASALRDLKAPVPEVVLPKVPRKTRPWLSSDDIRKFVAAVKGSAFEIPALMGLLSLRRSEIMAVTWDRVDLKNALIRVEGAVVQNDAGEYVYKETNKQDKSRRTVPIMIPELLTALEAVPESERKGHVVTCHPNSIYKAVNAICQREGLNLVGVHGLRHSFASLGHHVGVPEQEMQLIGGWNDATTMHKIYEHIEEYDIIRSQNAMSAFYLNESAQDTQKDSGGQQQMATDSGVQGT